MDVGGRKRMEGRGTMEHEDFKLARLRLVDTVGVRHCSFGDERFLEARRNEGASSREDGRIIW